MAAKSKEVTSEYIVEELIRLSGEMSDCEASSANVMRQFSKLSTDGEQLFDLSQTILDTKKTKLQKSVCMHFAGSESLTSLINVDLGSINDTNRNEMTNIACENLGAALGRGIEHMKSALRKTAASIKDHYLRIVNIHYRYAAAFKRIETFMGTEFHTVTVNTEKFATAKIKGYNHTDFMSLLTNSKALFSQSAKVGGNMGKSVHTWSDHNFKGMGIVLHPDNEVETDSKNKLPRTKTTLTDLGWSPETIFKLLPLVKEHLHTVAEYGNVIGSVVNVMLRMEHDFNTMKSLQSEEEKAEFRRSFDVMIKNFNNIYFTFDAASRIGMVLVNQYLDMFRKIKYVKKTA